MTCRLISFKTRRMAFPWPTEHLKQTLKAACFGDDPPKNETGRLRLSIFKAQRRLGRLLGQLETLVKETTAEALAAGAVYAMDSVESAPIAADQPVDFSSDLSKEEEGEEEEEEEEARNIGMLAT
jgi:hypothetical protein